MAPSIPHFTSMIAGASALYIVAMENGPVEALGSLLIVVGLTFMWRSAPMRSVDTPGRALFRHHADSNSITQNARQIRHGWTGLALAVSGLALKLFSFWM